MRCDDIEFASNFHLFSRRASPRAFAPVVGVVRRAVTGSIPSTPLSLSPRGVEMPLLSSRVRAVPRGVVAVPDPGEHQSVWRRRRRGRRPLPRRAQREQHVRRRPRRRLAHRRRHQHAHEFPQKPIRDEFDHQHPFRRLVPATRGVRLRSLGRRLRSRVAFPARVSSSPRVLVPADARHGALERARATLNAHLESFPGGVSLAKAQQSTDDSLVNAARSSFTFAASTVALGVRFSRISCRVGMT